MTEEVLVTGAAGFVGNAVVEALVRRGGSPRAVLHRRRAPLPSQARPVYGALDPDHDWRPALQGVSSVVHAAARVHVSGEADASSLDLFRRINVDGSVRLATQAAEEGVRRFVFISSISVNGTRTSPGRPFTPSDPPAPESPYGVSKLEAERALREVALTMGLELVCLRPPLVYGAGAPGNWQRLVRWAALGVPLPLGGIDNQRSLIGIDNLVDLVITCLSAPAAAGETLLVSDGEDVSTTELVRVIRSAMGRPSLLFPFPPGLLRLGAKAAGMEAAVDRLLEFLQIDISQTRETLGWRPPVSVQEGLRRAAAPAPGSAA